MEQQSDRAGHFVLQPKGYAAFIPNPLPPEIHYDSELRLLLSAADRAMARLDGMSRVLPNPDLFIAMYVRKEALLSSQIERTQASLRGVVEVSGEAERSAREIIALRETVVDRLLAHEIGGAGAVRLAYNLFERPIVTARDVTDLLGLSQPAANALTNRFVAAGILRETTGKQRYKRYEFREYLAILERGTGLSRE